MTFIGKKQRRVREYDIERVLQSFINLGVRVVKIERMTGCGAWFKVCMYVCERRSRNVTTSHDLTRLEKLWKGWGIYDIIYLNIEEKTGIK